MNRVQNYRRGFFLVSFGLLMLTAMSAHANDANEQRVTGAEFLNYIVAYEEFKSFQGPHNLEDFTIYITKGSETTTIGFMPKADVEAFNKSMVIFSGSNKFGEPVEYVLENKTHKILKRIYSK